MASQGALSPSVAANNTSVGSVSWSYVNDIKADDSEYAYADLGTDGNTSNYIVASDFGFTIPNGSVITGVLAQVKRARTGTVTDNSIRLLVGGVISGDNKSTGANWPGSFTIDDFGGESDLWGLSPNVSDINSSNFGVAVSCKQAGGFNYGSVEHITMTVYYSVSTGSASGTILFSGDATRVYKATRTATGTLKFSGEAIGFIARNTSALERKRYLYKVYEEDGSFSDIWKDVTTEPTYSQEINEIGSTLQIELARNSDSVGISTVPLLDSNNANITDSNSLSILTTTEQRNQVGPGSSVNHNNRVDIWAFYGSTGPLLDSNNNEILDSNNETIDTTIGAPNGVVIFTGFISEIATRYGSTETTLVQLMSYGYDLQQFPAITSGGDTTVPYLTVDPSAMIRTALTQFATDSSSYGTFTTFSSSSIPDTSTVISYTFKANTYADVVKKGVELMPSNWYFYVGLGDNIVNYRERSVTPVHTFYLGYHIKTLDLKSYIGDSVNRVLFTGGGDPALYKDYSEIPASRTRRTLHLYSDGRVTVPASADTLSEGLIDEKNKVQYRTTIDIVSGRYDIESINIGDTVGFRNFGNYVDLLVLQIVGLTYTPDIITLQLDSKPPTVNKRLEDLKRQLLVTENQNVPDAPDV